MSTQEQKKTVERQAYQTPQLEQHGQYVQITGASFGPIGPGVSILPGDDQ
jgi:hypothetical protein